MNQNPTTADGHVEMNIQLQNDGKNFGIMYQYYKYVYFHTKHSGNSNCCCIEK